jgi:hypothetical protein
VLFALIAPSVPSRRIRKNYPPHGFGGIKAKPKTPCEPISEMELALTGVQLCACARGTLRDEAGALPIKITDATVARILVVRIGGPSGSQVGTFGPRLTPELVNSWLPPDPARGPRLCSAFVFHFNDKTLWSE